MNTPPRHRRILVITGDAAACRGAAARLVRGLDALWITDAHLADTDALPAMRAHALLGGERTALVFDGHAGFDVEAFGACTGVVRGGGLFLLLAPPLEAWPALDAQEKARIADYPHTPAAVGGRFLERLVGLLRAAGIPVLDATAPHPEIMPVPPVPTGSTPDQEAAIAAIRRMAQDPNPRPLVLLADRGRGKSAALGLASAMLLTEGYGRVVITAPRPAAAETALTHARAALPQARHHERMLVLGDASLAFAAPDALAAGEVPADLVLVDEAAAIPAPLLERLLVHFPRIVFSTTVHGYEGTGQGFAVRFARVLERRTPGWHQLTLDTPVRWDAGDPLEALVFRALLLDAEPAPRKAFAGTVAHGQVVRLDRDMLVNDEALLREVFGLLILAHYRTSPLDLRQLLDGPNLSVFVLNAAGHVAGVALVVDEGGFPADLAHAVWAGRRRVRGHLLAQSLAQHAGIERAPRLCGRRIVRIAVHPAAQGRGLGRQLVAGVVEAAQGADYVGSSFGATPALLHFWARCGFRCVRIGMARDAASGLPSAMVMQGVSPAGEALLAEARRRFADALPHLLADPLRDLEPAVATALLADAGPATGAAELSSDDWSELQAFAQGARDLAYVLAPLHRLTALAFANSRAWAALTPRARDALVLKVVEGRSVSETAARLGLAGRRAVTAVLREAVQALMGSESIDLRATHRSFK